MNLDNVETFYPLSPAQQGILFHSLSDTGSFAYFGQLGFTFFQGFDYATFERAWRRVIARHAVLRTFFVWEALKEPVQVVQSQSDFSIEQQDWRHLSDAEQAEQLEHFLQLDRKKNLDLAKAPLMRFTLIRLSEESYRFIWSHHHILMDGWSLPGILNELLGFYAAFCQGKELELPAVRPYRDYIVWLSKQNGQEAENYWRLLLRDFHTPISLGVERKITSEQADESLATGSWEEEVEISGQTLQRLQELARARRLTLNTILQGAWSILLSKYSGAADVVYGATVSGRPVELEGVEEMVGLFINTLPVRVQVQSQGTVAELLKQIQKQQVETRQYEYSRLVDVQNWSGIKRGTQLFNSIFVFENYPVKEAGGDGEAQLKVGALSFHQKTNYPLTIAAAMGKSMNLRVLYDTRWYTRDAVRQILRHMVNIIEAIAAAPDQRVGELEIVAGTERSKILFDWNQTQTSWPADKTLAQLFEEQVKHRGDQPALVSKDEWITYKELDERSNQLAHHLQKKGVGPEQVVGVCLERGVSLIVALLGVLKAGGAFLPLDGSYPKSRLNFMLQDSKARVVITNNNYSEQFEFAVFGVGAGCELVLMDRHAAEIAGQSAAGPVAGNVVSENLAYIIYTSGSTGQPKGVMVQHRSVSNLAQAMGRRFEITTQSRVLQFASISFDASVSEIFSALLNGATLHLAGTESLRPGMDLIELLRNREISNATLPPSVLSVLSPEGLPHLRTVVSAGEACSPEVIARWSNGKRFINAYGPTETTVCATMSMPLQKNDTVTIGKAIENGQIFILDYDLRPVPPGVTGELYVGGEILARGYFDRTDLTAERFVPEPFSGRPGARMYKTGDLARYLPDGNIEYLRRIDQQQKIRGYRVEPGEIELALEQHAKIAKAVVTVREDVPGDKRLVAYLLTQAEQSVTSKELQHLLRMQLPEYMVPSAFVVMEAFPLTANGKVDRGALPAPDSNRVESGDDYIAPRNQAEQIIARIWCDVLQLEKVGVHDNFFDLGGQSLLLLQVHGKLKEAFDKNLTMLQMFGYPTVGALAEYFTEAPKQESKSHFRNIQERANKRREALKNQAERRQDTVSSTRP